MADRAQQAPASAAVKLSIPFPKIMFICGTAVGLGALSVILLGELGPEVQTIYAYLNVPLPVWTTWIIDSTPVLFLVIALLILAVPAILVTCHPARAELLIRICLGVLLTHPPQDHLRGDTFAFDHSSGSTIQR